MQTRYGLDCRTSKPPVGDKVFSVLRTRPDQPWGPPRFFYMGYQNPFSWVQRPESGVDHSPPYTAEVKNEWSCTYTSPTVSHGMLQGGLYAFISIKTNF